MGVFFLSAIADSYRFRFGKLKLCWGSGCILILILVLGAGRGIGGVHFLIIEPTHSLTHKSHAQIQRYSDHTNMHAHIYIYIYIYICLQPRPECGARSSELIAILILKAIYRQEASKIHDAAALLLPTRT